MNRPNILQQVLDAYRADMRALDALRAAKQAKDDACDNPDIGETQKRILHWDWMRADAAVSMPQVEFQAISDEVASRPCKNLRDLAALANICAHANEGIFDDNFKDLDWEKKLVRKLIEEVLSVSGEPILFDTAPESSEREQDRQTPERLTNAA